MNHSQCHVMITDASSSVSDYSVVSIFDLKFLIIFDYFAVADLGKARAGPVFLPLVTPFLGSK